MMARSFGSLTALTLALVACGGGGEQQQQPAAQAPTTQAAAPAAQPSTEGAQTAPATGLPPGVTQAMVDEGKQLFNSPTAICYTCHGENGKGMAGLGPNLGDSEWLHSDGSYDAIVKQIETGVPAAQSKSGIMMPPRGGSSITDDQVKAVAAYVWSLRLQKQ
jgi:mono/diheme cytochrome c family protein